MLQNKAAYVGGGVSNHFADTFLDAQNVRGANVPDKNLNYSPTTSLPTPTSPFCLLSSNCNIFGPSLNLSHRDKFQSDRCLTKTLHLQNLAADSQPSIPNSLSDHSSISKSSAETYSVPQDNPYKPSRVTEIPNQGLVSDMDNEKGNSLGKLQYSDKRNIRRTQSEAQVNKTKKSGNSFNSLKRAFSPFMFRSRRKDAKQQDEDDLSSKHVMKKIHDRDVGPIVMETGFPATADHRTDGDTQGNNSGYFGGLISPLMHPKNALNLPSVPRGSLILEDSSRRSSVQTETEDESIESRESTPCPSTPTSPALDVKRPTSESVTRTVPLSRTLPGNVNFSGDISHAKETLLKPKALRAFQIPGTVPKCSECNSPLAPGHREKGRGEMETIFKRYSPPKPTNVSSASLQRKLKEIKKELEESDSIVQGNQKIGEIRDKRNLDSRRLSSCTGELKDEVFYKKDEDILSSHTINASEDDYYKEVEVRINPEGIAVVRRRHRMLPDSDRGKVNMRRSTIHVDDRVFCDKAVLQSIYGHSPTHVSKRSSTDQEKFDDLAEGVKLRPFVHQQSVPNLHASVSDAEEGVIEIKDARNTLVSTTTSCKETDRLKREFHKSSASNSPIHKKYIRAYTKFYEQKLAMKLLDLNRFIKEEKETSVLLDERIQKSLTENDKLLKELNSAKQDILNMIKIIEIPV